MNIGVSTANLYPNRTEDSLDQLLMLGFKTIEVFVNTESEVKPDYIKELRKKADAFDAHIIAIHPYTSGVEPYLLFSQYQRRFEDGLMHYQHIFEAAALAGASYVILHGDKKRSVLSEEDVLFRYNKIFDLGKSVGITLLQENVVDYRSSEISFINKMRQQLKDKACFTFDIKQCRRSGLEPVEVIKAMGDGLKHVHISDYNMNRDCMLPGKGTTDYKVLSKTMLSEGFSGAWIMELYRSDFNLVSELQAGYNYLEKSTNS